jgi:hypothetical protein
MALRLRGATSGYIELKAPASAGDNTLTLPVNNGSANQLLKTDGSGNLSWVDDNSGVSLSGSTNNTIATVTGANALTGEANLTFNGSGDLTVKGNDGISANLYLIADRGDDNGDGWRAGSNQDQNDLTIANNTTGSYVDKITVLKTGEVGIGTSTPGQKLGVAGNIRFEAGDPTLEFNNGGAMVYARVANTLQFASGGGPASPTEKVRIDSTGRLMVGTTSTDANAMFHVKKSSGECGVWIESSQSGAGSYILLKNNSNSGNPYSFVGGVDAGGQGTSQINFHNLDNANNVGELSLSTRASGQSMTERLRITSIGTINYSNTTIATKNTAGDITIDFGNLTDNGGNAWRKCGVWIMYNGIDTDATDNKSVIYYAGVGSVTTWNWLGDQDTFTGDSFSSVTLQNAAATSFRLYCDVNNQNTGSVTVLIHAWNTKPTITIN